MMTRIFKSGNSYAVRIPKEFEPKEGDISIERIGERLVLTPVKAKRWPRGFFAAIRIADPAFARPEQGAHREVEL